MSVVSRLSRRVPRSCLIIVLLLVWAASAQDEWLCLTGSQSVFALAEQDSFIWAATFGGLARIHRQSGALDFFTTANSGLKGNQVRALFVDPAGNVWAGGSGVTRYDGTTWTNLQPALVGVSAVAVDGAGTVWAGSSGFASLARYSGTESHTYDLPIQFQYAAFTGIAPIWFDQHGSAVAYYSSTAGQAIRIISSDGVSGDSLVFGYPVTPDRRHPPRVWRSRTDTLIHYDSLFGSPLDTIVHHFGDLPAPESDTRGNLFWSVDSSLVVLSDSGWHVYTSLNSGLPRSAALSMLIDKTDGIWLGLGSGGVVRTDGTSWRTYAANPTPLPYNWGGPLAIDAHGSVIFGGYDSLIIRSRDTWESLSPRDTATLDARYRRLYTGPEWKIWADSNCAILLTDSLRWQAHPLRHGSALQIERSGTIWHATADGLWTWNGTAVKVLTTADAPLGSNYIVSLCIDTSGTVWVVNGAFGALNCRLLSYDVNQGWKVRDTCRQSQFITDVETDASGRIWFSKVDNSYPSTGGGVFILDPRTGAVTAAGQPAASVTRPIDLTFDSEGALWIGADGEGLVRYGRASTWKHWSMDNSRIPDNDVYQVEIDGAANKWMRLHFGGYAVFREGGLALGTAGVQRQAIGPRAMSGDEPAIRLEGRMLHLSSVGASPVIVELFALNGRMAHRYRVSADRAGACTLDLAGVYRCAPGVWEVAVKCAGSAIVKQIVLAK